ncbi:MAG: peptidase S53 [Candidatus Dormibacteraeota bacterium]|uniref:Peptidase S53 n=1 Tax=Candidatus Aeolococcus gillhamiae TaxID=3127015 RepID=A0A2W5Z1F9_9BACT|nr:peptidase S53 [Candidatus Dormibacteraeota bacterium]PZR77967.1 MAG: peptidase S53 [Candidatus Dormibacter sp. RRmetagenome_bin12]
MANTVHLAGSARLYPHFGAYAVSARPLTEVELAAPAVVTTHLRESPHADSLGVALARQQHTPVQVRRYVNARELVEAHGSDSDDLAAVTRWATGAGLRVRRADHAATTLELDGSLGALARAFGVTLEHVRERDAVTGALAAYRDHHEELSVPSDLDGVVTAALGLSDRAVGRPRLAVLPRGRGSAHSYRPEELARIYDFPVLDDGGEGQRITVGIAELGGAVYRPDLAAFAARHPRLRVVEEAVHGRGPTSDPFGPDTEVALDWQVIAGILAHCAPQADVLLVIRYAPNTDRGFSNLEASFATDGRDYAAVSTSWGAPEDRWTPAAMDTMDRAFQMGALRGMVHSVAAGDNGSTDARNDGRQHADHPASAPHAVGCGGTRLVAERGQRITEEVWNELGIAQGATGGGVSEHFAVPRYQAAAGIRPVSRNDGRPGRGVPDVAGNADPLTGYTIHHRGVDSIVGGTSAVAPLWTALFAVVSASTGHRLGNVLPALYGARDVGFTDVTTGDNGAYPAVPGWDAATGLGAPSGRTLCAALRSSLVLRQARTAAQSPQPATAFRHLELD